ncbi:MAG: tRNA (adenosine(37)-N6)-threonylcarbamoyltransferase complex transferase subunit TsaD [Acidobacteria bacterium]|nr:MAG: tRNA (adenosine(37)-N6)-threonylcarbamoyltransferase complex transferase subunit TsaD [Acidobacteriota bacterium]
MKILGIETSCDETAAAVVTSTGDPARPWAVASNVVSSQTEIHREWGGIVPEIASRQHVADICGVVEAALEQASTPLSGIDAIAVTEGPGLVGSLLVGVSFAKALAAARGLPIVGVHHLAGHIESLTLEHGELPLPAVILVVSGGHTSLYFVPARGEYRLVGQTRDDAAGEAYDKVARLLGLGYPGGPVMDRLAAGGRDDAVALPVTRFTRPDRNDAPADIRDGEFPDDVKRMAEFSFSGLKTAAVRHIEQHGAGDVADFCASFQRVVVTTLVDRLFAVASRLGARSVGIAGGVSANRRLRADAAARGGRERLPVFVPAMSLSTDNAAMIAAAGLRRLSLKGASALDFNASASLPISR